MDAIDVDVCSASDRSRKSIRVELLSISDVSMIHFKHAQLVQNTRRSQLDNAESNA